VWRDDFMTEHSPYDIRTAVASDAAVIARHRVSMFREMGHVPTEALASQLLEASAAALASLLRDRSYVGYLAMGPGQQVIAGAGAHLRPQLPRISSDGTRIEARTVPLLVNVYTEPQWRRRGMARELVLALMRWATHEGFDQVVLHASEAGRPLYASLGFAATNEMRWTPRLSLRQPSRS
jgi:GNAT superfamily N-acetyltransferase